MKAYIKYECYNNDCPIITVEFMLNDFNENDLHNYDVCPSCKGIMERLL